MTVIDPPEYDHHADLTPPHFFDPDPQDSTSCKFCGDADGYGVLHLNERPAFEALDDGPPPVCPGCSHFAHLTGPCYVVLNRWTQQTCECKAREAA